MGVPLQDEGKGSEVGSAQGGHVQKNSLRGWHAPGGLPGTA